MTASSISKDDPSAHEAAHTRGFLLDCAVVSEPLSLTEDESSSTPAPAVGDRWVVSVRDMSDRIQDTPEAFIAIVYDRAADWLLGAAVEESIGEAVASAFRRLNSPSGSQPRSVACDPRATAAVRLQCSRFVRAPEVITATDAELMTAASLFQQFLEHGPRGAAGNGSGH